MGKDGTARGGVRIGQGRPRKPLVDKVKEGKADGALVLPTAGNLKGVDVPPVKEYLLAKQKSGTDMHAKEVYEDTYQWLNARGCETLVSSQLVEQYAMSVSRWIQCEEAISKYGFLAKHPTTGNPIASPYVAMAQSYMKQVNQVWWQIFQIVKENCSVEYEGRNPMDDTMEMLLRIKEKR